MLNLTFKNSIWKLTISSIEYFGNSLANLVLEGHAEFGEPKVVIDIIKNLLVSKDLFGPIISAILLIEP